MTDGSELFNGYGWRGTVESAALPDGRTKTELRLHRAHAVHIIPEIRPGTILMLREYRPFLQKYVWMLPAGKADKENDMEIAAQRELREETGYRAGSLTRLCTCFFSESVTFRNYVFIARDLTKDPLPQDETELIETHEMHIDDAIAHVTEDEPIHAVTGYALLRYARQLPRS